MTREEMELFEEECWTEENDTKIWEYWDNNIDTIDSYKKNGIHPDITYEEFRDSALHFIAIGRLMEKNDGISPYKNMLHQMMMDVHNVGIDTQDEKQRETLMSVAHKLAFLCDKCN